MPYDYSALCGRITEKFGTQARFADAMNLSERSVSMKLNGKIGWKQCEMTKASVLLDFALSEIPVYFFKQRVQN